MSVLGDKRAMYNSSNAEAKREEAEQTSSGPFLSHRHLRI
jgi:hypothetical protein